LISQRGVVDRKAYSIKGVKKKMDEHMIGSNQRPFEWEEEGKQQCGEGIFRLSCLPHIYL